MTTRLASVRAELNVLRGLCSKNKKIAGTLFSSIDSSYFYSDESRELYEAIKRHLAETGEAPTYRILLDDPDISDEALSHMRNSVATIQTVADAAKAARILNRYRQTRGMFNLAAHINDAINGDRRLRLDELLEETATAFNIIRSRKSNQNSFLHFGRNNNSKEMVEDILYGDNTDDVIPTGIKPFDDESGGFLRGSLVTIGANTGGGKSLAANAMGIKMALRGYKVLMVPLEMSKKEMTARTMANTTKTNLTKILLQRLASGERDLVYRKQRRWERRVKEAGGRYTIFKPNEDMTIEEIMASISAYQCDVVIIDYISLLKGVDNENMWRALGAVARYAKINAEIENRVNILLCQVSEDAKIRYARAISEHSSNSWVWVATKALKKAGIIPVDQPKSRNSLAFPFFIKMVWQYMRVEDVPPEELPDTGEEKDGRRRPPRRRRDDIPNLAEADI